MASYYVHTKPAADGDHEVHVSGCAWLPDAANRKYLGEFGSCQPAVAEARKQFTRVNGCRSCCPDCHR
jgi:hypothetical protein